MKYMGWSWLDYCHTPTGIIEGVLDLIEREQRENDLNTLGETG